MKTSVPKWNFSKPANFRDQVKSLPKHLRGVLGEKMNSLAFSDYPNRLGQKKITKHGEAFVLDLDYTYRLSYLVEFDTKTIEIIRVGDHKEVHGKG